MRLDKYLKVSRLIKRRTVANEACDNGRISVNGRVVKASYDVKVGDRLEIAMGLYEKDTGRGVVCRIGDFPYTLIWSKPGVPKFVCIEPWHSLPSPENGSPDWSSKPAAATLAPGESWSATLSTSFVR